MWKRLDAFAKPREDLRQQSILGGIITLVASIAAGLLFFGQLYVYVTGVTRHSLHLSKSQWHPVQPLDAVDYAERGRINVDFHISFPHITCSRMDFSHDGMSYKDPKFRQMHGISSRISTRPLLAYEWQKATGSVSSPSHSDLHQGCTFEGHYFVSRVGGAFTLGLSTAAWREASTFLMMGMQMFNVRNQETTGSMFNTTHFIHHIYFGEPFALMKNPLQNDIHVVRNEAGGIGVTDVQVKVIPTQYQGFFTTRNQYQLSVTEHIIQPETLASQGSRFMPGLAVSYDFTPLAVHHVEARDSFLIFLSSLISIVGGVFVTVSLVTGCLVHSAAAIAKKID